MDIGWPAGPRAGMSTLPPTSRVTVDPTPASIRITLLPDRSTAQPDVIEALIQALAEHGHHIGHAASATVIAVVVQHHRAPVPRSLGRSTPSSARSRE